MDGNSEELIAQFVNITGAESERARFYLEASTWSLDNALSSFYDATADETPESPRIGTMAGIRHHESSDSSEEEGQAFYAGGSETSGQQIIGPPRPKANADELVSNLFKSAREHGAEEVAAGSASGSQKKPSAFKGTAYRLGDETTKVEPIKGATEAPQPRTFILKMWNNGFSLDDGELREYRDPNNQAFLTSVRRGEIPQELTRVARGGEVSLDMEDHRHEDFVPTKKRAQAFGGTAHMLGSPAPSVAFSQPSASRSVAAGPPVKVDSSKPTTNIQIRLQDGSRLVANFNLDHTVADIRRQIVSERGEYSSANFVLLTTFPNKELTDDSVTIQAANLLNAVIVQRFK